MGYRIELDGHAHTIAIVARRPHLVLRIDGRTHVVETVCDGRDGAQRLTIDGETVDFSRAASAEGVVLRLDGRSHAARPAGWSTELSGAGFGANVVRAPMPGTVVAVARRAGETVRRGETVLTIESMKLQMALAAPRDGTIAELTVDEGDGFDKDAVLARLAAPAATEE